MLWISATFLKFLECKLILSFPQEKYVPVGMLVVFAEQKAMLVVDR